MPKPERRCAIYTRKSSEEELEQDFNSLHAQREACEAFIRSQQGEGWRLIKTSYDDRGVSGGTLERPALQQLCADIASGRVDIVVVYKVDRLTRSLVDFAKLVELFDRHNVSFVAVTQQFNTTTSMGRLTLNILLSFAQFEREVTGERIRDKIAASKRKGLWMGGVTPLGYEVKERKLVPVPTEAEKVRSIYARYLELGSVRLLKRDLDRRGVRSKVRVHSDGTRTGGNSFSRGALYALLSNPIYTGEISHKRVRHPGQHPAIVERSVWEAVQQKLREQGPGPLDRKTSPSPLAGKLFDSAGGRLSPSHASKDGRRYRYYISTDLTAGAREQTGGWRLPASQLEAVVADGAAQCLTDQGAIAAALDAAGIPSRGIAATLKAVHEHQQTLRSEAERGEVLAKLIERVEVRPDTLRLTLRLVPLLPEEARPADTGSLMLTRELPLRIKRRGVETRLVIEGLSHASTKSDPILLKEIARAYRYFDAVVTGKVTSYSQLSFEEGIDDRYVRRILPLAFLATEIVQAIFAGKHPLDLTAKKLIRAIDLPLDWQVQKQVLGFR
jgi:DNA invertase Pin-like site-specific DNA recombinase